MFFASDNAGPVPPQVLEALTSANQGRAMPYGKDPMSAAAAERIREVFEAPEAAVYLVATGTASNALALATLGQPWQTVFCAPHAHVHEDECGAPEFYSDMKLTPVGDLADRMTPEALAAAIASPVFRGVEGVQPGAVTLTQATERGTVYALDKVRALTGVARAHGLPVHMDGARFANALVSLGCTPAEMTWKAGVDVVSFGGTKNGLMGVEAVILFDPARAWEFELRRKRGGHLFSKHRYLAAQMLAYLEDDLWLDLAARANAAAEFLADGLMATGAAALAFAPEANSVFATWPRAVHRKLHEAGAVYYMWNDDLEGDDPDEPLLARMVCDWSITREEIDRFLGLFRS